MADIFDRAKRSEVMSKIRGKWTGPELRLHGFLKGSRIRHVMHSGLPGRPDAVLKGVKIAVFVDGCFWHRCPRHYKEPGSNVGFWRSKIAANMRRDWRVDKQLRKMGYGVIRIWECRMDTGLERLRRAYEDRRVGAV